MTLSAAFESKQSSGDELSAIVVSPSIETPSSDTDGFVGKRERSIIIIGNRALDRECLAQSLRVNYSGAAVSTFGTVDELRRAKEHHHSMSAILLSIGGLKITDGSVTDDIEQLKSEFAAIPLIIVADNEDLAQIMKALENGVCGYIPTTVGISVAVGAIELALAGGVFVPASSILSMRELIAPSSQGARPMPGVFTARQSEVGAALRCGKANKIIAYELNMCESTVKVHVRNIMKKLKATNRTEAAYKMEALLPPEARVSM